MPRNVHNFWLTLKVDGKASTVETGPQAKDGGFSLTVKMREDGGIVTALHVRGYARGDGTLELQAYKMTETTNDIIVRTVR